MSNKGLKCSSYYIKSEINHDLHQFQARPQPKPAPKPALKPASKSEPKPSQKKENNPKNPAPEATEPPKITPAKADAPKVTVDKTAHNTTTVTANIVVNTTGADTNKTDSYRFQSEEEDALRLLRLHQAQEAFQNSQKGVYNGG